MTGFVQYAWSRRRDLSRAQLTICAALDGHLVDYRGILGGATEADEIALSTVVLVCGRRGGKTTIGALWAMYRCETADLSTLAPGQVAKLAIVAPSLAQARELLDYCEGLGATRENRDECSHRGVIIRAIAAARGGGAVRGPGLVGCILDEAAFFQDANHILNADDIYDAAMPSMANIPGGKCLVLSSPWAKAGFLWDCYEESFAHPKSCVVFQASTRVMQEHNASVLQDIDRAYRRDASVAEREYGASFDIECAHPMFPGSLVDAALLRGAQTSLPPDRVTVSCGIDAAATRDWFGFAALGQTAQGVFTLAVDAKRPQPGKPVSWRETVAEYCRAARALGSHVLHAEPYCATVLQEFCTDGVRIEPYAASDRAESYQRLREALDTMRIDPAHKVLGDQLRRVQAVPMPNGTTAIRLLRSTKEGHLDIVSAAAAASMGLLGRDYAALYQGLAEFFAQPIDRYAHLRGPWPIF